MNNWLILKSTETTGGLNVEGENDSWDFGTGAGFYVDATNAPYDKGYNMYSYVTEELPKAVFAVFDQLDSTRVGITGHSMGGHGALTLVGSHSQAPGFIRGNLKGRKIGLTWLIFKFLIFTITQFLKNPGKYKSVSAFAPISNPINCPWGQKAFKGYLGNDVQKWKEYDATELVKKWKGPLNALIDVVCTCFFSLTSGPLRRPSVAFIDRSA